MREEMADVLNYLVRLADKLDVNLLEAARDKIEVNAEKYPVEKARGSARSIRIDLRAQCAPMATNYVLVDFENVQPDSLAALANGAFRIKVFVGAAQARGRISFELSHSMQMLGTSAEYVRIARSGPNAVDMHIAYYVGRLIENDKHAVIYIVSRDTDFDPLVEYLQAGGINCKRAKSIAEIVRSLPKPRAPMPPPKTARTTVPQAKRHGDKLAPIIKHLHSLSGKPGTRKKLGADHRELFPPARRTDGRHRHRPAHRRADPPQIRDPERNQGELPPVAVDRASARWILRLPQRLSELSETTPSD